MLKVLRSGIFGALNLLALQVSHSPSTIVFDRILFSKLRVPFNTTWRYTTPMTLLPSRHSLRFRHLCRRTIVSRPSPGWITKTFRRSLITSTTQLAKQTPALRHGTAQGVCLPPSYQSHRLRTIAGISSEIAPIAKIIQLVHKECKRYRDSLDESIEVSKVGLAASTKCEKLCLAIVSSTSSDLQATIKELQSQSNDVLANSQRLQESFRMVRDNLSTVCSA